MATLRQEDNSYTRLNCRVRASIKRRAEEAAEILGQSITAFAETALAEKAEQVFSRFGSIQLSELDFQLFLKTVAHPPAPTAKLRKAAAAYKKLRARNAESNW